MRKILHDGLSSGSLNATDSDAWSKKKVMTHPTRAATDTNSLTI